MSTTICLICLDNLDGGPEMDNTSVKDQRVGTTTCGHVLHLRCLLRSWDTVVYQDFANYQAFAGVHYLRGVPIQFTCPVCGTQLGSSPCYFQLYPSFADSYNDERDIKMKEMEKEIEYLRAKVAQLSLSSSTSADK